MGVVEVLGQLAELGITPKASGNKLLLTPGSKVPIDLFAQVKKYKAEIIERLGNRYSIGILGMAQGSSRSGRGHQ